MVVVVVQHVGGVEGGGCCGQGGGVGCRLPCDIWEVTVVEGGGWWCGCRGGGVGCCSRREVEGGLGGR